MKFERVRGDVEIAILASMATDKIVLSRLRPLFGKEEEPVFRNRWAGMAAAWCCRYFDKYGEAPPPEFLQQQAEKWAARVDDPATAKMVDALLDRVYEFEPEDSQNSEYSIDKAGEYFNKVRVERLAEDLTEDVERDDMDAATDRLLKWGRLDVGVGESIDVLHDYDAMREAFEDDQEVLIEYPGGLGKFFGRSLQRDAFVGFLGPEKRGKSFVLMDVAWRAMKQRRRVAVFEVGDMSRNQVLRRLGVRAARRPMKECKLILPREIQWDHDKGQGKYKIKTEERSWEGKLGWREATRALEKTANTLSTDDPMLRLSVHPNSSVGVDDIERTLDVWERTGWVADVVVIDYADNLLWPAKATDERSASNLIWKHLRRLSQERHNLVVTATQASADSYSAYILTKRHFSEDKRKLAHVTAMFGLNMTEQEKKDGVFRLNTIVGRDLPWSEFQCVLCAGRRELANLFMKSTF